jgi:hypothetical protein
MEVTLKRIIVGGLAFVLLWVVGAPSASAQAIGSAGQDFAILESGRGAGTGNAITVDSLGGVHMAYYSFADANGNGAAVHYFMIPPSGGICPSIPCGSGGPPPPQTVALVTDSPLFTQLHSLSIASDANNHPHIVYQDGLGNLMYAFEGPTGWVSETVDSRGGLYNSIAMDANGNPHIAYCCLGGQSSINYAIKVNGAWVLEPTFGTPRVTGVSIALDSSGVPHIAYADHFQPVDEVYYASRTNGHWFGNLEGVIGLDAFWVSLALDASNNAHISYLGWSDSSALSGFVGHAIRQSFGFWNNEGVDIVNVPCCFSFPVVYQPVALGLSPLGQPRISYGTELGVKLARKDFGVWKTEFLDTNPLDGFTYTSLAVDAHSTANILYRASNLQAPSIGELIYARRSTVSGDVNGDGVVDCADVAIVKASFGKRKGQVGFVASADINSDGVVNIVDLVGVERQLPAGTRCP